MAQSPLWAPPAVIDITHDDDLFIDEDTPILHFFANNDIDHPDFGPRTCHCCGGVVEPCPTHMQLVPMPVLPCPKPWRPRSVQPDIPVSLVASAFNKPLLKFDKSDKSELKSDKFDKSELKLPFGPTHERPKHWQMPWPCAELSAQTRLKREQSEALSEDTLVINASGVRMARRKRIRSRMC